MGFQISIIDKTTFVTDTTSDLRVVISEEKNLSLKTGTAYSLGTLYEVKGGFIPINVYVFTVIDTLDQPLIAADLKILKAAMDFFFLSVLSTDLYVKEIPQQSSLYAEESLRLYGTNPVVPNGKIKVHQ